MGVDIAANARQVVMEFGNAVIDGHESLPRSGCRAGGDSNGRYHRKSTIQCTLLGVGNGTAKYIKSPYNFCVN